jgi:hypothetical protein
MPTPKLNSWLGWWNFTVNNHRLDGSKQSKTRTHEEHEEHLDEQLLADSPPASCGWSARHGNSSPGLKLKEPKHLSVHGSPKRLELLRKDLGEMWSVLMGCFAPKFRSSNELNCWESNRYRALPKARVPNEILQSEAEFGVWGIMIKHKDAQGNYPWSPPTSSNPNTSESKEQAAHKNPTKIAR